MAIVKRVCEDIKKYLGQQVVTTAVIAVWWVLFFFAPARAYGESEPVETPIPFHGKDGAIFVQGDPIIHWIGDPAAMNSELVLVWTNSAPDAVNRLRTTLKTEARVLVVGSGASGGFGTTGTNPGGGGGGGGEVVEKGAFTYEANTYTITVGKGGAKKEAAGNGNNGQPSKFATGDEILVSALGGGGGGAGGAAPSGEDIAGGGGGSKKGAGGQGKISKGGNATSANNNYAGGGGGAGGNGGNGGDAESAKGGSGGAGLETTITDGWFWFDVAEEEKSKYLDANGNIRCGGGGGGGQSASTTFKDAGTGTDGGGHGGCRDTPGEDGIAFTGGGGGGGGRSSTGKTGGAGGDGVVIVRIIYLEQPMVWKPIDVRGFGGGKTGTIFVDENATVSTVGSDIVIVYSNTVERGGLSFKVTDDMTPEQKEQYKNNPPIWALARVLAVGGGGGGGLITAHTQGAGGGGGAGGVVTAKDIIFDTNDVYSVVVGAGGAGGAVNEAPGESGKSSTLKKGNDFVVPEAIGGGGGGAHSAGLPGGSGGGGSRTGSQQNGGAGTPGQGYAGGTCVLDSAFMGAGGGGAGGPGEDADSGFGAHGGAGGAGVTNDITGAWAWYAGGGGGAYNGSSLKNHGGKGGSGIGGDGAGTWNDVDRIATSGRNGTGSGGGGGASHVDAAEVGGSGGSGIVIIRLSGFVVDAVPVPTVRNYIYDGNEHTGVEPFYAYTFNETDDPRTHHVGVNSYVYAVAVHLRDGMPYEWCDGSGRRIGKDDQVLHWKIAPLRVVVPKAEDDGFVFTTTGVRTDSKNAVPWADENGLCWTNIPGGATVPFCSLADYIKGDAGDYKFTATLANDYASEPNVTNFTWHSIGGTGEGTGGGYTGDDPQLKPRTVDWSIAQASNAFTLLKLDDWQEGVTNRVPRNDWTWRAVAEDYARTGVVDRVLYSYATSPDGPWGDENADFNAIAPAEAGEYWLRATICVDSNHRDKTVSGGRTVGNWSAATNVTRFCVWRHPSKMLTDYVDIELDDSQSRRALKVTLEEASGASGLHGFTYARAGDDGSEIRFVAISNLTVTAADAGNPLAGDELLAYTNRSWTVGGRSETWVMLPTNGTKGVRMYWRRKVGVSTVPPDKLAQDVSWPSTVTLTGTFGLVNQEQPDLSRVWVNWWKSEPDVKRNWNINELDEGAWYAGTLTGAFRGELADGAVTNRFDRMPDGTEVRFPDAGAKGAYLGELYMLDMAKGTEKYPGRHILYDGTRTFDLEIVEHDPTPIDPDGPEGATLSGRVLTANDDTNAAHGVELQGHWRAIDADNPYWVHEGATPSMGVNLLPGSVHALRHVVPADEPEYPGQLVTNELWTLSEVYVGNLMTNDDAVADAQALSNRWNALPWSPTSKANSAKDAPFSRREAGHLVLRNLGAEELSSDGMCAEIRSQVYTNGIGTVYFDAVNVYAGEDVDADWYKLVVEVSDGRQEPRTNIVGNVTNVIYVTHWDRVKLLPLYVEGQTVTRMDWADELDLLDVRNGGQLGTANAKFYRVLAKVNRREPTMFRIRRTSAKVNEGGLPTDKDDADGWILVDNVVASWPAPLPSLKPTGAYDPSRHANGAPVLGVEGAFSTAYPSVVDDFLANVRLTGGGYTNVASARIHYRWRYADTEFDPARLNGRDSWRVAYFNVTNTSFSTVSPLVHNGLPGDIEYYFDLTAFVPFYSYADYSGCGLEGQMPRNEEGNPWEEPPKNAIARSDYGLYPSYGTNWFVRIREFPSAKRGWTLYTKTSETGAATAHPLEMLGATDWRACVMTAAAVERLYFRLESESPSGPQTDGIHTTTNFWLAESSAELPKRLSLLAAGSASRWATVPCDAKSGYLVFQVDEAKANVMVARADWQNFNRWSSGVTTNGLFVGSSVDTNVTSAVSDEYDALVQTWPVSVATNGNWSENFNSGNLVAANVYPRNVPFASATSLHGWLADNAMWTYGKWSLQKKQDPLTSTGDDSAVQLEGCGKGRLSLTGKSDMPDGLDAVTYHARIAQRNDADSVTWYKKYSDELDPFDFTNYTFAVCAALTETGAESYDGDGTMSMIAYYDSDVGFYEFRVSRSWNSTGVRLALFRWRVSGNKLTCEKLLDASNPKKNFFDYDTADTANAKRANIGRLIKGGKTPLGGLFISAMKDGSATLVTAGLYQGDVSTVSGGPEAMSGQKFTCLAYKDSSAKRLTSGTFGVMSANCPAVFVKPACYLNGISVSTFPSKANVLEGAVDKLITFNVGNPLVTAADFRGSRSWKLALGRMEPLTGHDDAWGLQASAPQPQDVYVQVAERTKEGGLGPWTSVATNTVRGFKDDVFPNLVRDARKLDVRLQMGGTSDDERTDVAVSSIELTQWNGQWTANWDDGSEIRHYLSDKFVYTSAWNVDGACRLQPSRTQTAATPVSIRTPLMRGLGLLHFKWRNADPRAKLKVQVNEEATLNNIKGLTEAAPDSSSWETVETVDFGALGASGSKSVYVNRRYNGWDGGRDYYRGMIRIVVDEEVERAARQRAKTDERYGSVEITEMFSWDLREYDSRSWSGWNFRCAGWVAENDGRPDRWANLADGFRGLSGLLNNTLDESTLADREKGHYNQNPPHIQSPAFLTNCIGAVSFRARLYDPDDLISRGYAAVVTVYGNNELNEKDEPKPGTWKAVPGADILISNRVYTTHTVKLSAASGYKAIRLGIKGVKDVVGTGTPVYDPPLRVALDDVCVWERQAQSLTFRKRHVRPFRDAEAIKGRRAVADIDGINEQPLIGEAFGFQAEVEVQDEEEVLTDDPEHPITVDLWYYQGAEPWGFENWKTSPDVVRVTLTAADGTNFIYRSTADRPASLCPPQLLQGDEAYRIVQYHAVATYYDREGTKATHDLLREEWPTPEWYAGFADPNASHGDFSAYTMLERIAPKRAWINEINLCEGGDEASKVDQWVEIAVPSGVDMTGWKLRLYELNRGHIADLMTFGNGCPGSKQQSGDPSHYDFYVVRSPQSTLAADATWKTFTNGSVSNGKLKYSDPYGFELVRPTGIVEHDVVVQGWNLYREEHYDFAWQYDGTNLVRQLTENTGRAWVWSDEDYHLYPGSTVGVITNQGMAHVEWKSPMGRTPGGINEGQYIDPNWFVNPNGGYVWIYSTVLGGHMRQILGGETNTVGTLTVPEGTTTNIVYEVDRWYQLGQRTVTPPERTSFSGPVERNGKSYYTLTMSSVSNRIDVQVASAVSDEVEAMIPPSGEAYRPAVMKWLERGETGGADGGHHPFKGATLKPAWYRGGNFDSPLPDDESTYSNRIDLVGMYWLDIDPTEGGWELWGNMGNRPGSPGTLGPVNCETNRVNALGDWHTNILTTVWLELRNTNSTPHVSYPPYRLQGLNNEQSDLYTGSWTSVTFQVAMQLMTDDMSLSSVWRSMRYFVFGRDSFRPADDPVAPYAARIEVIDPFSRQSPAWEWGWWKYADRGLKPFTKWRLNANVTPGGVSTLHADDFFEF